MRAPYSPNASIVTHRGTLFVTLSISDEANASYLVDGDVIEITRVVWRGVDILSGLTAGEIDDIRRQLFDEVFAC